MGPEGGEILKQMRRDTLEKPRGVGVPLVRTVPEKGKIFVRDVPGHRIIGPQHLTSRKQRREKRLDRSFGPQKRRWSKKKEGKYRPRILWVVGKGETGGKPVFHGKCRNERKKAARKTMHVGGDVFHQRGLQKRVLWESLVGFGKIRDGGGEKRGRYHK